MTATELVELIAKTLWVNGFNDDDPWDDLLPDDCDKDEYLAKAHAVVEALTEAGTVEWGVRGLPQPFPFEQFSTQAIAESAARVCGGTVVSRLTLPWTKAVE